MRPHSTRNHATAVVPATPASPARNPNMAWQPVCVVKKLAGGRRYRDCGRGETVRVAGRGPCPPPTMRPHRKGLLERQPPGGGHAALSPQPLGAAKSRAGAAANQRGRCQRCPSAPAPACGKRGSKRARTPRAGRPPNRARYQRACASNTQPAPARTPPLLCARSPGARTSHQAPRTHGRAHPLCLSLSHTHTVWRRGTRRPLTSNPHHALKSRCGGCGGASSTVARDALRPRASDLSSKPNQRPTGRGTCHVANQRRCCWGVCPAVCMRWCAGAGSGPPAHRRRGASAEGREAQAPRAP